MKAISFLGANNYTVVDYTYNGVAYRTEYMPEALNHFFAPDSIYIFATKGASAKHQEILEQRLGGKVTFVPIPDVTTEAELWVLFDVIAATVLPSDTLILDITLGFRSIPFIASAFIAYIRLTKAVTVYKIVYGNFEANRTSPPILDLTAFLSLVDWTMATTLFVKAGYAEALVACMEQPPIHFRKTMAALRLTRNDEARVLSRALIAELEQIDSPHPSDKPFIELVQRVRQELQAITPTAITPADLTQELRDEYALFHWNVGRGQLLSAITIAREWLVSVVCYLVPLTHFVVEESCYAWQSKKGREQGEKVLNALKDVVHHHKSVGSVTPAAQALWHTQQLLGTLLAETWYVIAPLRNDLNHAGKVHTSTPRALDTVLQEIEQSIALLSAINEKLGLAK